MRNTCFRILVAAFALTIAVSKMSCTAHAALGEPVQAASTAWWWYDGQTPDQVASLLSTNNARLVSLRVQSSTPLLLDVAMVQNTGTFTKTWWWWYYGLTAQQLADTATANDARIANLEPYVVNGTTYFAAIMLHNVGADYTGWWWYYGITADQVKQHVAQNNARLIDLRRYDGGGSSLYGAVMMANSGGNQSGWWWYYNITADQVKQYVAQNNAYPVSLDPNPDGNTFNVLMSTNPDGFGWWWYYGQTDAEVTNLVKTNAARIFDLKSYRVNGVLRFAVLMLGNS